MDLTVAICTRNRSAMLGNALDSLCRMNLPSGISWELIVVDNNSTDDTGRVIDKYKDALPIRHEFEQTPGLSRARNRAIDSAQGSYIIWTDDDVLVDSEWLVAYAEAFRRHPDAAVFGGKVIPRLDEPVPAWLKETWPLVAGAFAYVDFGNDPIPITLKPRRLPFGANFAVRTLEQRRFRYDIALGLAPGKTLLGEEVTVIKSILTAGGKGSWVPTSIVHHCIPRERQTKEYIFRFYEALGRTLAYEDRQTAYRTFLGVPVWLWRRYGLTMLSHKATKSTSSETVAMQSLADYAQCRGAFDFWRNQKHRQFA